MEYCCFNLTDRAGIPNIVDTHTVEYVPDPVQGKYCVDTSQYPKVFHSEIRDIIENDNETSIEIELTENKEIRLMGRFFIGWQNLPTWQYFPEEDRFDPIDPQELKEIKRWYRREKQIQTNLRYSIKEGTELKKLRKAILAIADILGKKADVPAIQELRELTSSIEHCINTYTKEENDKLDMYWINGISKKRMDTFKRTGVDFGPTGYDMKAEDAYDDNGKSEMNERRKIHKNRIELEKKMQGEKNVNKRRKDK